MTRTFFEVKSREGAVAFLRSMYNLKSVVRDADAKWARGKEALCRDLFNAVQDLPALSSQKGTSNQRSGSSAAPIDRFANSLSRQGYTISKYSTLVCAFYRWIHMCSVLNFGQSSAPTHCIRHHWGWSGCIEMCQRCTCK